MSGLIDAKELADAYVKVGNEFGFFWAEMILMKHLPKNKPGGKCYDVRSKDRPAFLQDMENAVKFGIDASGESMIILTSPADGSFFCGVKCLKTDCNCNTLQGTNTPTPVHDGCDCYTISRHIMKGKTG